MKAILIMALLFFTACAQKLPDLENLKDLHYDLVNQKNEHITFPDFVKGKIVVMNYIFTNCPDICPLSTNNMRLIQERLKKDNIQNVYFISVSFDPENDSPEVLTKFAEIRNLDLSNWQFLTGNKLRTDMIIEKAGVLAVKSDSTIFRNGRKIYYYIHTDRISLVDQESRIRKNYLGSKINVDEIVNDIKTIVSE